MMDIKTQFKFLREIQSGAVYGLCIGPKQLLCCLSCHCYFVFIFCKKKVGVK